MDELKYVISLSATARSGAVVEFETKEERELFLNLINAGKTKSLILLTEFKKGESEEV